MSEVYSETSQTSKMEILLKIVNVINSLTFFAESSILDVWLGSKYESVYLNQQKEFKFSRQCEEVNFAKHFENKRIAALNVSLNCQRQLNLTFDNVYCVFNSFPYKDVCIILCRKTGTWHHGDHVKGAPQSTMFFLILYFDIFKYIYYT